MNNWDYSMDPGPLLAFAEWLEAEEEAAREEGREPRCLVYELRFS